MPLKKRKRKWFRLLGIAAATFIVLWIALPLWFPWVLRPIARKAGGNFSRYEREGYSRFTLHDVTFTNRTIRFRADSIGGLTPGSWLWRAKVTRAKEPQPFVRANGWHLHILPTGKKVESVHGKTRDVENVLQTLEKWIPAAAVSNGTLIVNKFTMDVPGLVWTKGRLQANVGLAYWTNRPAVNVDMSSGQPRDLRISSDSLHLQANIRLAFDPAAMNLQSTTYWRSNRIDWQARFDREGLLPETSEFRAPDFHFSAELARLKDYQEIRGSASMTSQRGQFAIEASAEAVAPAQQTNRPPFKLDLRARGGIRSATIETAVLSSAGLQAELSPGVEVHFSGPLVRQPATLRVAADLGRLPWFQLHGNVSGEVDLTPSGERLPVVRFRLAGSEAGDARLTARTLNAEGSLDLPWLEIAVAQAQFEDGSAVSTTGRLDLARNVFENGGLQLSGPIARQWLPPGFSYENLTLSGTFHGPLTNLSHTGTLAATNVTIPGLRPLQLRAQWQGTQLNFDPAQIDLSAGKSSLRVQGSSDIRALEKNLRLTTLTLSTNGQTLLELAQPFGISASGPAPDNQWRISSSPLEWRGESGAVHAQAEVNWPQQGAVRLAMETMRPAWFADFTPTNLPDLQIRKLEASAGWTNGPAVYAIELLADGFGETNLPLSVELKLTGDQRGLALSNFVVSSESSPLTEARGFLPLTLTPGARTNIVHLNSSGPLQFTAMTRPHSIFWNKLSGWTGVVLREPNLTLDLSGNAETPQGAIKLEARQIQIPAATAIPLMEDLRIELQLDRQQARLVEGRVHVQGQLATLTGEMPLGDDVRLWIRDRKLPDWRKASARFQIERADLAAFAGLIPQILGPQGELSLNITLAPGGKLDGALAIEGARTRPLPGIGPIRDIVANLKFHDQTLLLENAAAKIGSAPLTINGYADLRGAGWLRGELPHFEFILNGTNVPLVRQPDIIVRSDLAVSIAKTNGEPPIISGSVQLRDSFFLSDLTALIPGGRVASPRQRPPYFSVEDPFLANWRLALRGTGDNFMRIRSTIFNGEISANLDLRGTLHSPLLTGDVTIDSGLVRFPFASLRVEQGFITLTIEDPFRPQISVTAKSRQYGFDVQLNVNGPVNAPVVQFNSSPPLSSEQILMMITTGQLPRGRFNLTSQQRAQTVAVFVARDLLFRLGVGDEADQRLTMRSGEEITESGKPTYSVEYRLTDRWSLVGEYDRFGDFNAGIKWRVYSK